MIINTQTVKKEEKGNENYSVQARAFESEEMIYPSTKTPLGEVTVQDPE